MVVEDERERLSRSTDNYVLASSSLVVYEFDDEDMNGAADEALGTEHVPMAVGDVDMPDGDPLVATRRMCSPCLLVPRSAATRMLLRRPAGGAPAGGAGAPRIRPLEMPPPIHETITVGKPTFTTFVASAFISRFFSART